MPKDSKLCCVERQTIIACLLKKLGVCENTAGFDTPQCAHTIIHNSHARTDADKEQHYQTSLLSVASLKGAFVCNMVIQKDFDLTV